MRVIDVRHMGRDRVIGCWEVDGFLIDPGPESSLETLLEGLGGTEPRAILLTHIHFDHAGATGAILRRWPDLPVYVHERGAPHLVDPERLVRSATRLYGEEGMRDLWGEVVPVPEANLRVLKGGERDVEGAFRVEYTPGHASHHVCFLHEPTGTALVGDVGGVRIPPSDVVVAPTPPPDIDLEAWEASLRAVEAWGPERLAITHFGQVDDVPRHMSAMRASMDEQAELAREVDLDEFIERHIDRMEELAGPEVARMYLQAAPPDHLWLGLDRYWSRREM
jgi:glyoxylase-like metal-dependent hydrolase (beta-lactamase superfamily II)